MESAPPAPEDRQAAAAEPTAAIANLPSLEQIQANLPEPAHGSSCGTGHAHEDGGGGCGCGSSASTFRAKAEPLVQILAAPGAAKPIEALKPAAEFQPRKTKVPLRVGEQRLIIATCEKGAVEDLDEMKGIRADIEKIKAAHPNFVDIAVREVFRHRQVENVSDPIPNSKGLLVSKAAKERAALMERRKELRIGIPRLLNTYTYAPLFNAYFASLGVQAENIVYSD